MILKNVPHLPLKLTGDISFKYKVVIEGHADEISWYVNYISDKGLISVIRNGGSDHQIAPSKVVNIHTKKGIRVYRLARR